MFYKPHPCASDTRKFTSVKSEIPIDMNYNWTNYANWLLRLRLKPEASWADPQYSVGHDFQKKPTAAVHCAVHCAVPVRL